MTLTLWSTKGHVGQEATADTIPVSGLRALWRYLSPMVPVREKAELVLDPSCPPRLLELAARNGHLPLRHAAAQNPSTPPVALGLLSTDVYSVVCEAAIANPSTPTRELLNGRILSSPALHALLVEALWLRPDAGDVVTAFFVERGDLSSEDAEMPLEYLFRMLSNSGNE